MVNASGTGYRMIELSNLSSTEITGDANGTALATSVLDVTVNGTKLAGVDVTIMLTKMRPLNMTLAEPDYLDAPVYGTADMQQEETATASTGLTTEGSSIYGNITEKFLLQQLPNPFK